MSHSGVQHVCHGWQASNTRPQNLEYCWTQPRTRQGPLDNHFCFKCRRSAKRLKTTFESVLATHSLSVAVCFMLLDATRSHSLGSWCLCDGGGRRDENTPHKDVQSCGHHMPIMEWSSGAGLEVPICLSDCFSSVFYLQTQEPTR